MNKILTTISVVLGIIASLLQISGTFDFISPTYAFLTSYIPVYYTVLVVIAIIVILFIMGSLPSTTSNILDREFGRMIALECRSPRTTEYLRKRLDRWKIYSDGFDINNYLIRLENQDYVNYVDEKWVVTQKAFAYIQKYHGN